MPEKKYDILKELEKYILKNSLHRQNEFEKYTLFLNLKNGVLESRSEDIDIGVCGVILFLIELYKLNKSLIIREAIAEAGEDLIHHCLEKARSHFGFFKGRAGVCFTLMKIREITNDERYIDYAIETIKNNSDSFIESEYSTNRLYDGRSGLLIVLLHLYSIRPEEWILYKMNRCLNKIVYDFIPTEIGIIWNRNNHDIKPNISFLYGSSGVAFALNQYGIYFDNQMIINLAEEITRYEDHFWDKSSSSWPDFRKEITTAEEFANHRRKLDEDDQSFFSKPGLSHDLAYGTAGICMARYLLMDSGKNMKFKKSIKRTLINLCHFDSDNRSMINGIVGVAESLLISTKYFDIIDCSNRYKEIANILKSNKLHIGDISLFRGITSIGYFLLHADSPESFDSVFFPIVRENPRREAINNKTIGSELLCSLFQSCFPTTAITYHIADPGSFAGLTFSGYGKSGLSLFDFLASRFLLSIKKASENTISVVMDIYNFETGKIMMLITGKSKALYYIKRISAFEEKVALLNMSENEFAKQTLIFCRDLKVVKTGWNWTKMDKPGADVNKIVLEFLSTSPGRFKIVLFRDNNINAEMLDVIGSLTKSIFRNPCTVNEALKAYIEAFEPKTEADKVKIIKYTIEYILYLIRISLLHRN